MKQEEDEPEVIFDPEVGRFVPPPERRPVPRGCLAAFLGAVGGVVLGALTGALLAPPGGGLPLSTADLWGFYGAILGFLTGTALGLLVWFIGRALWRRS